MAWNGSGIFSRIHNWVVDRDSAVNITASRMDAEMDGMATGITDCLTKNGENSPSADLPMATYRHTGVSDANARDNYPSSGQAQDSAMIYAVDSGAADAYVMTLSPAITAYSDGQSFIIKPGNTNTGAVTVNINSVGAVAVVDEAGSALSAGDFIAGRYYGIVFDGTSFRLSSVRSSQFLRSDVDDEVTGIPSFNGGLSGSSAPFIVGSTQEVANLNAELLGGIASSGYALVDHTHGFFSDVKVHFLATA